MIDLAKLRENPDYIITQIKKKDPSFDAHTLFELDKQVKDLRLEVEELRALKNQLAQKAKSGITQEIREESIAVGKSLKEQEKKLKELEHKFEQLYLSCPNIPFDDVPVGDKDKNVVIKQYKEKPDFSFSLKNHVDLGESLNWLDFEKAAKMTGSNFVIYKTKAAKLLYALTQFMLEHNISYGYNLVLPPYLVNAQSLTVSGNFPKFKDQVYSIKDEDLYLSPTAEVNIANLFRDYIFSADELPARFTAWTSCFRREAGAYGSHERGLIRMHQFEKVELYTFCEPEQAQSEFEHMLECVESLLKKLDLHYRVSFLAAQDCSFPSAKTYDIEVWLPAQGEYYEVSSVSNCTDFQARRGKIRYRKTPQSKTEYVYTLNGSCLALPRLMVALMETHQQPDGTIKIPDVLQGYGLYKK